MAKFLKADRHACDGYIAFNDGLAIGVLRALRDSGIAVPEDVSVVGWDDSRFARFAELTTLHVPTSEIGRQASMMLYEQLTSKRANEAGKKVYLDTPLLVRKTSARKTVV
jgi:DNA-binding LacI/PurR family transcriptional regulator